MHCCVNMVLGVPIIVWSISWHAIRGFRWPSCWIYSRLPSKAWRGC
ncbi:UNVERIFIED_CONTAM: hypothetical protein GTU68_009244 [Idotea baltica]|nr:hypothetical protein [Idotea baltica]